MNPLGFQLRLNGLQKPPVLFLGQLMDPFRDGGQGPGRGHAIRSGLQVALGNAPLEPRHPDHEKFVHIGAEYGHELDPFEQGHTVIEGFFKHAPVEFEPGQFTVDEGLVFHWCYAPKTIDISSARRIATPQRMPESGAPRTGMSSQEGEEGALAGRVIPGRGIDTTPASAGGKG